MSIAQRRLESQDLPVEANEGIQPAPLQRVVPFEIAGRQWIVQFAPTKEYLIAQRGWQAWSVLAGGLFFTGLLGGFLLILTGHTAKLQAINTDLEKEITERKRAEDAVTQLAAIVESSDDAIVGTTLEGAITSWNKGAEIIYGYSAEEVKGRSISILFRPIVSMNGARLRRKAQTGRTRCSVRDHSGAERRSSSSCFSNVIANEGCNGQNYGYCNDCPRYHRAQTSGI